MKAKLLTLGIICLCMCFILTGCGENNKTSKTNENTNSNTSKTKTKEMIIADTWMSQPENIDYTWKTEAKSTDFYSYTDEYKRGYNGMLYWVKKYENGKITTPENDGITNEYYYYHYKGDYKWNSYCYFSTIGWDSWYFHGNYPSSPQIYCFGKPWNILDNYSDEHETIYIEGVGNVDTVKGVDDEGYTYYYSKKLNMNVKLEVPSQTWTLIKYDSTVSSSFPRPVPPNMDVLDAKKAKEAEEAAKRLNTIDQSSSSPTYELDENGELIIYDD